MTDSNRPRPRPRPKPVQKTVENASEASSARPVASTSLLSKPSTLKKVLTQDDGDAMFMKNRNRSTKTWQKLEEINKDPHVTVNSDSDSDENDSPRSRKRGRKKVQQVQKAKWQQDKERIRILSVDLSSDSDSDLVEMSDATPNAKRLAKRKRQRSRSKSITPPPTIPLHQVQNVKNIVRQALGVGPPRPPSPTMFDWDDPADTVTLDPELESIALKIRAQTPLDAEPPTSTEQSDDGEVVVNVTWKPHPLNQSAHDEKWIYKITRNDNFRDLFEAVAEDARIMSDSVIMSYEGNRIFSSVTPQTLGIWDEVEMLAYEKQAYDYMRAHPELTHPALSQPSTAVPAFDISDDDALAPSTGPPQTQDQSDAESEADGDTLKLIFRSSLTGAQDIALTVRPTTKCGSILKAFLRKAGLMDQYPNVFQEGGPQPASTSAKKGRKSKGAAAPAVKDPRLCVDGDKMSNDSEIGEAGLEDGDLVEVVGL